MKVYDAIIVGSGATGGWAARQLTEAGLNVLVLEAGRKTDPAKEYNMLQWPWELKYRGFGDRTSLEKTQPIQSKCYACNEYSRKWFVNDFENPYTTPPDKPFYWIRSRQTGGRSLPWGRQSYRLSNFDFKAKTHDGYGDDWPFSYEDLVPYYERVERYVGISGREEKLPQLPDSIFLPPMNLTCGEMRLRDSIAAMKDPWRRLTIGRVAILTKPVHVGTKDQRAACHYCGHCERGCDSGSYYSSISSVLPAAARTGRMTLVPHAVVSHVLLDKNSKKAKGVYYVDGISRAHREAYAKAVLICAGTLESTRILLNSQQYRPDFGAASGALGHYLMDHTGGGGATGAFPMLKSDEWAGDGRANGIYVPRFRNLDAQSKQSKFIRGYGYQGGSSQSLNGHAKDTPGFGSGFKQSVRNYHPWSVSLGGFGECLARYENQVSINKDVVDAWGIPALHIDMEFGHNERALVDDMGEQAAEMLERAGATDIRIRKGPLTVPGIMIHEVGTTRMGNDPKKSVLNKFNQMWDCPNVFVTDGACYVSNACQNPTLTMMSITARACDYVVSEMKSGKL